MGLSETVVVGLLVACASAAPYGFPKSGNGLWYTQPGDVWSKTWLPVGNGYLGAMLPGGTVQEATQLNIESLWSGGPFADPSYNGGNKLPNETAAMAEAMKDFRQRIFASPNATIDNVTVLNTDAGAYGSYSGAGFLLSTLNITGPVSNYGRWLNLDDAIYGTTWTQGKQSFSRETFCSYPSKSCSQYLSTSSGSLPALTVSWSNYTMQGFPLPNITCFDSSTLRIRGFVAQPGMLYELLLRASSSGGKVSCAPTAVTSTATPIGGAATNATLTVQGAKNLWLSWVGGTEYDMNAGDAAHGFSFRGVDPHAGLVKLFSALPKSYSSERAAHVKDVNSVLGKFSLDLGAPSKEALATPTDELVASYEVDTGNAYLEWVTFNYGRYMLFSSARGALPANLQGKWAFDSGAPWSGDYHANINIQMNYWSAHITNLHVTDSLWDYIQKTWAPRGEYTAKVLYNISRGWTTHNEMNIFGHTGMKAYGNSAEWANYPESNVWMMIHVYDRLSFTNDVSWWRAQGWPLLKSVALFHLDKLIPDDHFDDGTLVTAPCNSPEQAPITFGCAHQQTMIWQLFNAVEKGYEAAGDDDAAFLEEVRAKRAKMDKGVHIGSWGQLQEWKFDMDSPNDTHRHLSHLIGVYPGYAVSSFNPSLQASPKNYTRSQVLEAAKTSLIHRGNGTGPDADAGWEKVWRAAQWAQHGDADTFYHELTYALQRDFGPNLYSLYDPLDADPIFQIDANLGYPAAVMNALVQTPDIPTLDTPLTVTLLPALPKAWATGSITAARVRGGVTLDLAWKNGKPTKATLTVDANAPARSLIVVYAGKTVASFKTTGGLVKKISF